MTVMTYTELRRNLLTKPKICRSCNTTTGEIWILTLNGTPAYWHKRCFIQAQKEFRGKARKKHDIEWYSQQ